MLATDRDRLHELLRGASSTFGPSVPAWCDREMSDFASKSKTSRAGSREAALNARPEDPFMKPMKNMRNMKKEMKRTSAVAASILMLFWSVAQASPVGVAGLEGRLTDVNGRAAAGWRLHVIDETGRSISGETDLAGGYAIEGLAPGVYALGVEDPDGRIAPVAAAPVHLASGRRAQRNIKLVTATSDERRTVAQANHGLGVWWASLSPTSKTWVALGGAALVGISVVALDSDDDEPAGSPF